jgi:hypothetical protein
MKSMIVSVLALVCVAGCAMEPATTDKTPDAQPATNSNGGEYVPIAPGNPGTPCGAKSTFIINTPDGIVIVDVPAFCNPSIGPDRGDPAPDYVSDPNPWEKDLNGSKVNPSLDTKR